MRRNKSDSISISTTTLSASRMISSPYKSNISDIGDKSGRLEIEANTSPSLLNIASHVPKPSSVL